MELELVRNERNKLRIGGLALGGINGVAKEALQGIQVSPVPGHFDGMADGTLHPGRRGLEGFRHLGVQNFRDSVDHIHIVDGDDDGFAQVLVALDVGRHADLVDVWLPPHRGFCRQFIALFVAQHTYGLLGCSISIVNSNFLVKFETNEHLKKVFSEQIKLFYAKSSHDNLMCEL